MKTPSWKYKSKEVQEGEEKFIHLSREGIEEATQELTSPFLSSSSNTNKSNKSNMSTSSPPNKSSKLPSHRASTKERLERAKAAKARMQAQNNPNLTSLNDKMETYPMLKQVEVLTGIPKQYMPIIISFMSMLLLFWGVGMPILVACVGFVYTTLVSAMFVPNLKVN